MAHPIIDAGPTPGYYSIIWNQNNYIVAGGNDGLIIFDGSLSNVVFQDTSYPRVTSINWSVDGNRFATTTTIDNSIEIWDIASLEPQVPIDDIPHTSLHNVLWSPDGTKIAATGNDKSIRIWDAATYALLHSLERHTNFVSEISWNADSSRLISGDQDGKIFIWNAATGELESEFQSLPYLIFSLGWSPDGNQLAVSGLSENVRV